jgi:site-specific DNA recombinase|tara:strand:+ start:11 stop:1648 length:1638 start_codon:yes stop_codon:yes gene_type:complete
MPRKKKQTEKPEKIIAALYCRVSTYDQTTLDFSSLDSQEQALKDWCKQEGWQVFDVYTDKGISAKDLNRPALKRLRNDARTGKFNQIIYTKMDRLSRSLRDHLFLSDEFEELNIITKSKSEPFIGDGVMGRMFHQMLMVFSEMERQMIAERNHEKAYQAAKAGRPPGGRAPIGYDYVKSKLKVNQGDKAIVKRIFTEYNDGEKPIKIAEGLNADGYSTPIRVTQKGRNKGKKHGGKEFDKRIILQILANKTYLGLIKFHDEEFTGKHTPIISKSLFKKSERMRKKKTVQRGLGMPKTSDLLLLGIIHCGYCGSNMTSVPSHKKTKAGVNIHYYYRCTKVVHSGVKACKGGQISAKAIEGFITDWLEMFINNDQEFHNTTETDAQLSDVKRLKELKSNKSSLSKNLKSKNSELNNLMNIAKAGGGKIKEIANEIKSTSQSIAQIENQINEVELEMDILSSRSISPNELIESLKKIVPYLTKVSREELRNILNLIIRNVHVKKPTPPNEKWAITVNVWSQDPNNYIMDVLSGSCYRPLLYPGTDSNG